MTRKRKLPRCVPVMEWPEKDREAWAFALRPEDIFDGSGSAAHLRAPSVQSIEQAVGRFLGWLEDEEHRNAAEVAQSTTIDVLRKYVGWLRGRVAPFTVLGQVRDLHEYLRFAWPNVDRSHVK